MLSFRQFVFILCCVGCSLPPLQGAASQNSGAKQIPFEAAAVRTAKAASLLDQPEKWPYHLDSQRYPITVRYLLAGDREQARRVIGYIEHSWEIEIDKLGFPPPFPSDSTGSRRLQVYLQRGADTAVEATRPVKAAAVWWDAWQAYLSIDAWGKYGGEILDSTTSHEFNHALHAALDWYESPGFFETTATYIQEKVYPEDNDYLQQIEDFQQRPEWPVHAFDDYKTWYAYGACLYLFFLEQRYFAKQPQFISQVWKDSRNKPRVFNPKTGAPDPLTNEPDWIDALEGLLPRGVSYPDTVVAFARWRYYTGRKSDGQHFHEGALLSRLGEVKLAGELGPAQQYLKNPGPKLLGSQYFKVQAPPLGQTLKIEIQADPSVRWAYQWVPALQAGQDGEIFSGAGNVSFGPFKERVLIATALPAPGQNWDPDLPLGPSHPLQIQWLAN
ncbi:hypothetical protein COW20_24115 [bacterium (Candidatus Blackallbacteria) CG13_big_fil_rev_8_21_14_2_50_49_14]|nr:MAG: hypothetical protein COW64_15755 [bacterium (Candidatus Blackallbacteria) CG18_big_fil_WC_8_21_14_2_50_49_26]PIW44413.1 MAG: hypothetical protein COW20_24115 [bacterium (Candidatus Blackallbacteria) CG13_big_fil_rev_8_21_14_2_50_49_14]